MTSPDLHKDLAGHCLVITGTPLGLSTSIQTYGYSSLGQSLDDDNEAPARPRTIKAHAPLIAKWQVPA